MALTKITTSVVAVNSLTTANIADNSIDATKIASNSILTRHIDDAQITTDQILDGTIATADIADDAVTEDKLANAINTSIAAKLPLAGGTLTGDTSITKSGNPVFMVKTTGAGNNPVLRLQADTNKWDLQGTFSNSNDELFFMYNSSTKMTIDKDGNVGIGETSPDNILHIKTTASGGPQIQMGDGTNYGFINFDGTSLQISTQRDMVDGTWYNTSKSWGGINIQGNTDGSKITMQTAPNANTSPSTRFIIDKDGNVGIGGTPDSSGRLLVTNGGTNQIVLKGASGSTNLNMGNFLGGGYISNNYYYSSGHQNDDSTKGAFEIFIGDSNYAVNYHSAGAMGTRRRDFAIDNTGKVGIGNNDPSTALEIGNASSTYVQIRNASSGDVSSGYNIKSGSTTTTSLYGNAGEGWTTLMSGGSLGFRVNQASSGFNPMNIDTSGRVTTPYQTFFSVKRSGNQTFANAAWVDVIWNSETTDTGGNFASNTFTAPVAGVYLFTGLIGFNTLTATGYVLARIVCSSTGDFYITHEQKRSGGGDYGYDSAISDMITLAANETVKIQVFASGGGNHTLRADTRWQGRLMG